MARRLGSINLSLEYSKRYMVFGLLIGVAAYAVIFLYVYKGHFLEFFKIISHGNAEDAAIAYVARVAAITCHALAWWMVIRIFRKGVSPLKILEITFAAIFVEFIVPIGGATEIAKLFLILKMKVLNREEGVASILIHRILISAAILITTLASLILIWAPPALFIFLGIPAGILCAMNAGVYVLPKSKRVERLAHRILSRFGVSVEGFAESYKRCLAKVKKNWKFLMPAVLFAFGERFSNAVFGIGVGGVAGVHLTLPQAFLTFDSLYTILWLLPAITPGGIGIYEFIQTLLLSYIGIRVQEAATMSIISRIYYVVGEYPLFIAAVAGLGYSVRSFLRQALKARPKEGLPSKAGSSGGGAT